MDEIPVVCTLTLAEQLAQREELLPGLLPHAFECVELSTGFRLWFEHQPTLLVRIAKAVERQGACCRFLRFSVGVERNFGRISLDVSGDAQAKAFLANLLAPLCSDSNALA